MTPIRAGVQNIRRRDLGGHGLAFVLPGKIPGIYADRWGCCRVAFYDVESTATGADGALSPIARIEDPTIETVGFLVDKRETLITTHTYKVTAWRKRGNGDYLPETVYRSKDPLLFAEGARSGQRVPVCLSLGQANATIHLIAIPAGPSNCLTDGPHWLASKPDVYFGTDGAVYRTEDHMTAELMPPLSLSRLKTDALSALSPSCRPADGTDYRGSSCWPAAF